MAFSSWDSFVQLPWLSLLSFSILGSLVTSAVPIVVATMFARHAMAVRSVRTFEELGARDYIARNVQCSGRLYLLAVGKRDEYLRVVPAPPASFDRAHGISESGMASAGSPPGSFQSSPQSRRACARERSSSSAVMPIKREDADGQASPATRVPDDVALPIQQVVLTPKLQALLAATSGRA